MRALFSRFAFFTVTLLVFGLGIAAAPSVHAQASEPCTVTCTDGTQPVNNFPMASCSTACENYCRTSCTAVHGGCSAWRCSGGAAELPNGDGCAASVFTHTPVANRGTLGIVELISSKNVSAGRWLCRVPENGGDAATNCLAQERCSGSTAKCCVPIDRRSCQATAVAADASIGGAPTTNLQTWTRTTADDWFCQNNVEPAVRGFTCLNSSAACPGRSGYRCCAPTGVPAGFGCAASDPADAATVRLEQASGATRDTWYCRRPANATDRRLLCADGSTNVCGSTYHCCVPPSAEARARAAQAPAAGRRPAPYCAEAAKVVDPSSEGTITSIISVNRLTDAGGLPVASSTFTCVRACFAADRQQYCVDGGCGDQEAQGVRCCAPLMRSGRPAFQPPTASNACPVGSAGAASTTQSGAGSADSGTEGRAGSTGGGFRIRLPGCVSTGNCGINDVIQTGAAFANFLFEISGAIFLAIFVYGGFTYLTALGDAGKAGKGKTMIVNAAIGMILVFGAGTLVRFVYSVFTRPADTLVPPCETTYGRDGFVCSYVAGDDAAEIEQNMRYYGCRTEANLCSGVGQDANFRCCPSQGGDVNEAEGTAPAPAAAPAATNPPAAPAR